MSEIHRVVCWFSCGAASAVATKLSIDKYKDQYPIVVAYCDTGSEHPDNVRFMKECEKWYGTNITTLKNSKYTDIYDVFNKTRYMAGLSGARCSLELKKKVREGFEDVEYDLQIFGFDSSETRRSVIFQSNNPLVLAEFPLIDKQIDKQMCLQRLADAGIDIPVMYKMGYKNNNCIGCVKGGRGYWLKIKQDFPEQFEATAKIEDELGVKLLSVTENGKKRRISLRELDSVPEITRGRIYANEAPISCGFICEPQIIESESGNNDR